MPQLEERIENGVNEARTLILGAQVLLGFGLQAAFAARFETLPPLARHLKVASLGLMVCATGLLVSPAPFHRIAERGADSGRLNRFISIVTEIALLPFALALGIDVGVAVLRSAGAGRALAAGGAALLSALTFWWGIEAVWRARRGLSWLPRRGAKGERGTTMPDLGERIQNALTEIRVVLPGAQALLGFQFIATLSEGFEKLAPTARTVHLISLGMVALATVFLMTPAAWHRIAEGGNNSERFHSLTGRFLLVALFFLGLGLGGDVYVVTDKVVHEPALGWVAATASLAVLFGLWFALPALRRSMESRPAARRRVPA